MWFLAGRMMKAAALVVVVVTATASNSYAEPAPASDASAKVPCSQHSAQRKYVYQPHTSWKSYLGFTEELDSIIARLICSKEGEEAAKMISRPKNTVGLVGNLKVIFDGDILLQNKFYTAENLKDIFNLEEVAVFDDRDGAERHISISGGVSDSVSPRIQTSERFGGSMRGAGFGGGKTIHQSGVVAAAINFGIYKGGPSFEATLKIFSKRFVLVPPQPSPHGGPGAPTAPHGNRTLRYRQVDDQIEKAITVGFNRNAELSRVIIEIKRNKNDGESESQRDLPP
ncbi:hypothetical protein BCC0191_004781 [Burkholderia ambifaria]